MCVALQCRRDDRRIGVGVRESPHAQLRVAEALWPGIVYHLVFVQVRGSTDWGVAVIVRCLVRYRLIHYGGIERHHVLRSAWMGVEVGPCLCYVTRVGPGVQKHLGLCSGGRPVVLREYLVITKLVISAVAVAELAAERPIGLVIRSRLFKIL